MKNFSGKFELLYEDIWFRYQQGGFLTGDVIRIKKDALKNEKVSKMSDQMKAMIENAIKSDLNLKVSAIKTLRAQTATGVVGGADAPGDFYVDVVTEYSPGQWQDPMTVPMEIIEKIETGINQAPIPDSLKRPNRIEKQSHDIGVVDRTEGGDPQRNLSNKNVDVPYGNPRSTLDYMPKEFKV